MSDITLGFSTPIQAFRLQTLSSHNKSTGENEQEIDLASPATKTILMKKLHEVQEMFEDCESEEETKQA